MSGTPPTPDPVAAAIDAATRPDPVRMNQIQLRIDSTGRPALIALPSDVTIAEVAEVAGWLLTVFAGSIRNRDLAQDLGQRKSRLVVARAPLHALGRKT